jgi:hypothetical protein
MKKYIFILACLPLLFSCNDFLDTENLTKKDTSNFPSSEADAKEMVTGIYSVMNNAIQNPDCYPFYVFEMASDDRLGGGSTSNVNAQCADRLMNVKISFFEPFWKAAYSGIYRANNAIESMDNVKTWTTNGEREQLLGESYFLRAYYYYDLATVFGEVPLTLKTDAENLPKASADEIYAQITSDLLNAIKYMPSTKYPDYGLGHTSKWAAEAMLARVFLFYTGFYGKTTLPVAGSSETVDKQKVVSYLEDCINNSGHDLVSDQRNLWPYSNEYTAKNYTFDTDNNLKWEGDYNKEVMFAINFSNTVEFASSDHPYSSGYANRIVEYFSPRKTNAASFPFTQGYSNGPASKELWDSWASDPDYAGDYRRAGSICDKAVETPKYAGDKAKEVENTGLLCKKYVGIAAYDDAGTYYQSYAYFYGGHNDRQLGLTQSLVLIRFADVLLMHSELTGTNTGMTRVRARAGLPAIPYSLEALKKERRYELCFEGLRWNDLRRWGDVQKIVDHQVGQSIINRGKADSYVFDSSDAFMDRYKATGGGFWKIPDSQVTLSNGILLQNTGWEDKFDWVKLPYSTI